MKAHFIAQSKTKLETEHAKESSASVALDNLQPMTEDNVTREQQTDFELPGEAPEIEPPLQPEGKEQPIEKTNHEETAVRRSGRIRKPPSRYKDYVTNDQELAQAIQASMTTIMKTEAKHDCIAFKALHVPTEKKDYCEQNPMATAMKPVTDPDTFYLWEARKEDDFPKFLEAMQKEVDDHTREGHWKLVRR